MKAMLQSDFIFINLRFTNLIILPHKSSCLPSLGFMLTNFTIRIMTLYVPKSYDEDEMSIDKEEFISSIINLALIT